MPSIPPNNPGRRTIAVLIIVCSSVIRLKMKSPATARMNEDLYILSLDIILCCLFTDLS